MVLTEAFASELAEIVTSHNGQQVRQLVKLCEKHGVNLEDGLRLYGSGWIGIGQVALAKADGLNSQDAKELACNIADKAFEDSEQRSSQRN